MSRPRSPYRKAMRELQPGQSVVLTAPPYHDPIYWRRSLIVMAYVEGMERSLYFSVRKQGERGARVTASPEAGRTPRWNIGPERAKLIEMQPGDTATFRPGADRDPAAHNAQIKVMCNQTGNRRGLKLRTRKLPDGGTMVTCKAVE